MLVQRLCSKNWNDVYYIYERLFSCVDQPPPFELFSLIFIFEDVFTCLSFEAEDDGLFV